MFFLQTCKTNPENKKVLRKSEAVKRSKTILSKVHTASNVLKIDDDIDEVEKIFVAHKWTFFSFLTISNIHFISTEYGL